MKKIKFTKRTIVALVAALLSLLGCATKVYIDGVSVEVSDKDIGIENERTDK